jgi:hypothetical protein
MASRCASSAIFSLNLIKRHIPSAKLYGSRDQFGVIGVTIYYSGMFLFCDGPGFDINVINYKVSLDFNCTL